MGGLRFLYAFELVLSPQDLETKVITIKDQKYETKTN